MGEANRAEESERGGEPRESLRRCDLTRKAKAKGKPSKEGDPHHPTEEIIVIHPSPSPFPSRHAREDKKQTHETRQRQHKTADGGGTHGTSEQEQEQKHRQHSKGQQRTEMIGQDRTRGTGTGTEDRGQRTEYRVERRKSVVKCQVDSTHTSSFRTCSRSCFACISLAACPHAP